MNRAYLDAVGLIERLHRYFLEVVKAEIDRLEIRNINNVQALLAYNIGTDELTVGELTERGYYLGSNVSYNLKKLVETGYVEQARSPHDRRSVRVKLSQKGIELHRRLDAIFERHAEQLGRGTARPEDLKSLQDSLRRLEGFWTRTLARGALPMSTAA